MLILFCMRGCGRNERPAFPAPSVFRERELLLKLARMRGEIAKLWLRPHGLFEIEVGVSAKTFVMPGLDPGIHHLRNKFFEEDGSPGHQAR
jgi:hypothetical protein